MCYYSPLALLLLLLLVHYHSGILLAAFEGKKVQGARSFVPCLMLQDPQLGFFALEENGGTSWDREIDLVRRCVHVRFQPCARSLSFCVLLFGTALHHPHVGLLATLQ